MTIEIRHLRAFLAIADAGNLSRATESLAIGQPALSRTLAQLERELGVTLLDRSTHHCELTPAGARLAQEGREALRMLDDAVANASGRQRQLRLGHSWSAGGYLAQILRAWNAAVRPCSLTIVRVDDRTAGLEHGTVDAAIVRGTIDRRRFAITELDCEDRVAVLPADHALAGQASVRLADLSGERLITTTIGLTTPDLWPLGQRPSASQPLTGVDDWLVAIATGAGVGVSVASTAALHPHPGVRYVPLADAEPVPVLLAAPRRRPHPSVGLLAAVATAALSPTRPLPARTPR